MGNPPVVINWYRNINFVLSNKIGKNKYVARGFKQSTQRKNVFEIKKHESLGKISLFFFSSSIFRSYRSVVWKFFFSFFNYFCIHDIRIAQSHSVMAKTDKYRVNAAIRSHFLEENPVWMLNRIHIQVKKEISKVQSNSFSVQKHE